jgi:pyruvate dehydrogenase E2 component (dihydrolipoyllysine-residue acetyltransferase)
MAKLLRIPEVAAGATEAVLSEWLVKEKAPFTAGDPIMLVETDKASVEIAAETDAMILRILVPGGTSVEVGSPVALLGSADDRDADVDRLLADLGVTAPPVPPPAPPRREVPESGLPGRVFISPLARKLLKNAGLTPDQITGTGPNGRIVRRDVDGAVAKAKRVTQPAAEVTRGFQEIPHSRARRAIAERLTASKQTIPHFYVKRTARVDELMTMRQRLNAISPHNISVNDMVLRAVAIAHRDVSAANVIWTPDALRRFESVDIAVAIAAERGLVTPVLRGVEQSSLSTIAGQVQALVRQAEEGTLRQGDLEGGSITVTNLGMFGITEFSAIINPPQSAILAVGAAVPAPLVVDGRVEVATQLTLVLSVDHRAIDGALAARWMAVLLRALEEPLRLVA